MAVKAPKLEAVAVLALAQTFLGNRVRSGNNTRCANHNPIQLMGSSRQLVRAEERRMQKKARRAAQLKKAA